MKKKSKSDESKEPSFGKKAEAVATGMGEGYFKSQSKEDQEKQKDLGEAIGTALGKALYS